MAKKDDALKLPPAALRFKPKTDDAGAKAEKGSSHPQGAGRGNSGKNGGRDQKVYLLKEGKPVASAVKTGIANNSSIELLESDLKEGDEVIVGQNSAESKKKSGMSSPMGPRF